MYLKNLRVERASSEWIGIEVAKQSNENHQNVYTSTSNAETDVNHLKLKINLLIKI
jgi:hypothetical protein